MSNEKTDRLIRIREYLRNRAIQNGGLCTPLAKLYRAIVSELYDRKAI